MVSGRRPRRAYIVSMAFALEQKMASKAILISGKGQIEKKSNDSTTGILWSSMRGEHCTDLSNPPGGK